MHVLTRAGCVLNSGSMRVICTRLLHGTSSSSFLTRSLIHAHDTVAACASTMRRANAASGLGKGQTSNASRAWRPRLLGEPPENCARTQIRLPRLCFERSLRVSLAATTSLEHLSEESGPCILPRLDSELKPDSSPSSTESQISPCKVADTVEAVRA